VIGTIIRHCDLLHDEGMRSSTIVGLVIGDGSLTFTSSATNRKEGGPMSNEISVLVKGMEEVNVSRQPSA
jgi:hypothetical protein